MPTNSEAARLNLEYYRKQAKAVLKAAQAGEPSALQLISRHSPKLDPAAPKLHDAQLAIAREQGFASWPRFRSFVIQSGLDFQNLVALFIDAAVSDLRRAEELLSTNPKLAEAGFYAALVLGDYRQVDEALSTAPTLATAPSGPQNMEPLLYVCFSRFARRTSSRAGDLTETARSLLRRGANPNASFTSKDWPENPFPCLYGATGLNNNPEIGRALLEAGAKPNDTESLYHSTEHPDLACVKLLLEHGATPSGNELKHMLDREDVEGVRLFLNAGADPNATNDRDETALHWAVWRGRSAAVVAALLDRGANIDARRKDGRSAYALAIQGGHPEVATLLASRGASTDTPEFDRLLGGLMTASPEEAEQLLTSNRLLATQPGNERMLPILPPTTARPPFGSF